MEMDFIHAPMGGGRNYVVGVVIFPTLINFFFLFWDTNSAESQFKKSVYIAITAFHAAYTQKYSC